MLLLISSMMMEKKGEGLNKNGFLRLSSQNHVPIVEFDDIILMNLNDPFRANLVIHSLHFFEIGNRTSTAPSLISTRSVIILLVQILFWEEFSNVMTMDGTVFCTVQYYEAVE